MSPVGDVVTTIHGNQLRRFEDGWSPLEGAHWDRWTVYTDDELVADFRLKATGCRVCACDTYRHHDGDVKNLPGCECGHLDIAHEHPVW